MAEPTIAGLEKQLRKVLAEKVLAVRVVALWNHAARIEWEDDGEKIGDLCVEPYQRGIGWAVVHELTHWVLREQAASWGELEEPQIEGLGTAVWRYVEASPRRYWWWRRAIRTKIKGGL